MPFPNVLPRRRWGRWVSPGGESRRGPSTFVAASPVLALGLGAGALRRAVPGAFAAGVAIQGAVDLMDEQTPAGFVGTGLVRDPGGDVVEELDDEGIEERGPEILAKADRGGEGFQQPVELGGEEAAPGRSVCRGSDPAGIPGPGVDARPVELPDVLEMVQRGQGANQGGVVADFEEWNRGAPDGFSAQHPEPVAEAEYLTFVAQIEATQFVQVDAGRHLERPEVPERSPGDPVLLHLSCSDPFTGGWGQSAGPVEGTDTNWQIAFFTIARYNSQGFLKSCGNVTNPFDVPNTATATGEDSSGTEAISDDAIVTIEPGITLDRLQTNGKRLTVRLTNWTGDEKVIEDVSIVWPNSNGNLTKVWLTYDRTSEVIWSGTDAPTDALLDPSVQRWNGGTLLTGEAILRFDFKNKSADSGYTIRVNFADGTFLDISQ